MTRDESSGCHPPPRRLAERKGGAARANVDEATTLSGQAVLPCPTMATLQRADRYGEPQRLAPAWTLTKGRKTAECSVWCHQLGWELRLIAGGELPQSQVVRSHEELVNVCMGWREAMRGKGWS